ncbi:MAG: protein-disulfide reductase DsbD N-terminal domain-containing protein [Gemmataceae bacterium]
MRMLKPGMVLVLAGLLVVTAQAAPKLSDSVVKIEAKAGKPDAEGNLSVVLSFDIDKDWHLYANPVPKDFPGIPTTISADSASKVEDLKVSYPEGRLIKDALVGDYRVYEGKTDIKVALRRPKGSTGAFELIVRVQACSDKQCLLPANVKVKVE